MNPFLLLLSMAGATLGGTIVHQSDASQQQPQYSVPPPSANVNGQPAPYPIAAQKNTATAQYYYPTYPEYAEPGYAVQTGYEGYLVPSAPTSSPNGSWNSGLFSALVPLARFAMTYGTRAGGYLLNLLLLLLLGGAFTTTVCTFTPFCTITILGLGLARNQVKEQVTELARTYMTPERVSAATSLVKRAIDKYAAMQKQSLDDEQKAEDAPAEAEHK